MPKDPFTLTHAKGGKRAESKILIDHEGVSFQEEEGGFPANGLTGIVGRHGFDFRKEGRSLCRVDVSEVAEGLLPDFPMGVIEIRVNDRKIPFLLQAVANAFEPVIDVGALNVFLCSAVVSSEVEGEAAQSNHAQEGCNAAKAPKVS